MTAPSVKRVPVSPEPAPRQSDIRALRRRPARFEPPADWPGPGPIDRTIHDLPHASSASEWWYLNTHFELLDGRRCSLFAAFFRIATDRDEQTGEVTRAHSVAWALTDASGGRYYAESLVDQRAPEIGLRRLEETPTRDPRLDRALREMLEQGEVPLPDRVFSRAPFISERKLELDFDGRTFRKDDDGRYHLSLHHESEPLAIELVLDPRKPPIRHGDDGVVRGTAGEYMFYYFIPRCGLTGSVTLDGVKHPIARGDGWYDHEFGGHHAPREEGTTPQPGATSAAWNWAGIQLSDGTDISAYTIVDYGEPDHPVLGEGCIVSDPDGERRAWVSTPTLGEAVADASLRFEPTRTWRSTRTFNDYPTAWRLTVPEAQLDVAIEAEVEDQEFITVISKPAFWEGRCKVRGTFEGRAVEGLAYIERSGFETVGTMEEFFGAVGEEVRKSVQRVLPMRPNPTELRDLVASEERAHYVAHVDAEQLGETLIQPVREIADRGGKSWRSYAALACCDVVGGDSRKWVRWLAMPELMHVGSLIVDDVQDESDIRRGGPTAHRLFGNAHAINSGTAAYFQGQRLLTGDDVSDRDKLRLYDLYFDSLRAGHAGQAIDLDGFDRFVPEVLRTGDAGPLVERILNCHLLKTGAPAGSLSRMGALVGGGTEAQIDAVGRFFEALGLAFQIVDDVLNLRGFERKLKNTGEDLTNGLVTLPVAIALGRLPEDERRSLYARVSAKPSDPREIAALIEAIERCGALDECDRMAKDMVEDAWQKFAPLVLPSSVKIMLRAFGWYVLERHY